MVRFTLRPQHTAVNISARKLLWPDSLCDAVELKTLLTTLTEFEPPVVHSL